MSLQGSQGLSSWSRAPIQLGADSPSCAPRRSPAAPGSSWARARAGAGPGSGPGAGPGLGNSALGARLGFQGFTAGSGERGRQHQNPHPQRPSGIHLLFQVSHSPKIPGFRNPHPFSPGLFQDRSSGTPSLFPGSSASRPPIPPLILFIATFTSTPGSPRSPHMRPAPGTHASKMPAPTWAFPPP